MRSSTARLSAMQGPCPRLPTVFVALATAVVLSSDVLFGRPGTARADLVSPPTLGVTWEFDCRAKGKPPYRLTSTRKAIEDGAIVVTWQTGDKSGTKHFPLSTWPLGFFSEADSPGRNRRRTVESGSLEFARLAVGEQVKAWIRQFDTRWGPNRWKWTAEITDKTTVETDEFGRLEVFVVEQRAESRRWGYAATIVTHYSPKLNTIVYWFEHDSNNRREECRLVSQK